MGDDTILADLLALKLHRVEDEVRNIVDKAVKELGIEKVFDITISGFSSPEFAILHSIYTLAFLSLAADIVLMKLNVLTEISYTWTTMEFSYEEHHRTGTPLLKFDEELIEILDDSQVQLQVILLSKYVEYFQQQVSTWQKKLTVADSVIFIWMEVQRTWSHLESIFIGSEDIRNQLPEDAKRFDGIDSDFKVELLLYFVLVL
eukprot:g42491.t1